MQHCNKSWAMLNFCQKTLRCHPCCINPVASLKWTGCIFPNCANVDLNVALCYRQTESKCTKVFCSQLESIKICTLYTVHVYVPLFVHFLNKERNMTRINIMKRNYLFSSEGHTLQQEETSIISALVDQSSITWIHYTNQGGCFEGVVWRGLGLHLPQGMDTLTLYTSLLREQVMNTKIQKFRGQWHKE